MKEVIRYIADDGKEFHSKELCRTYETKRKDIISKVNTHKDNPSNALITLMTSFRDILGKSMVNYEGYAELFRNHKPCAYACSLWRVLSDYSHDYPYIYDLYREYMEKYVALYGEPKKKN